MEKILKKIENDMIKMYLEILYNETKMLSDELGISSLELITNMVAQDYITIEELKELDKILNKQLKEKKEQ